jgi:hypothetical protein
MKFRVTMKDPDTLSDAMEGAVVQQLKTIEGINDAERELIFEHRRDALGELCGKWFESGEYVTIEIDTHAMTAIVVPNK